MVCPLFLTFLILTQAARVHRTTAGRPAKDVKRRLVINADPVEKYVPWQVVAFDAEICGGAIISKNLVLTAAHCKGVYPIGASVYAGIKDRRKKDIDPVQKRVVAEVRIHSKYKDIPTNGFDVCIVRVTPDFDFSDTNVVAAAHLPFAQSSVGEIVNLTGFGRKTPEKQSQLLRGGIAKIAGCEVWSQSIPDPSGFLCVLGQKDVNICNGDSGGPASTQKCGKPIVVGIASFTGQKCAPRVGAVYTDVFAQLKWIKKTWREMSSDTYPLQWVGDSNGKCADAPSTQNPTQSPIPSGANTPTKTNSSDPAANPPGTGPGADTPVAGPGVTPPGETSSGANSLGNPGHIAVGICCFFCIAAVAWYFVSHSKSAGPDPIPHAVGKPRPPKRRLSQQSRKRRPCKTTKRRRPSATSKRGRRK